MFFLSELVFHNYFLRSFATTFVKLVTLLQKTPSFALNLRNARFSSNDRYLLKPSFKRTAPKQLFKGVPHEWPRSSIIQLTRQHPFVHRNCLGLKNMFFFRDLHPHAKVLAMFAIDSYSRKTPSPIGNATFNKVCQASISNGFLLIQPILPKNC